MQKGVIYDNSNIAESYAGVTTPLTFSFVRYVYQEVYQYFSKMMGVNDKIIKKNHLVFENMVEFIGNRIYYNLDNWYKMLSFFPGYRFSGEFMEKMMGVEKHKKIETVNQYNFFQKYFFYFPKTVLHFILILIIFLSLKWRVSSFNQYFDKIYAKINFINLNKLSFKKLQQKYKDADKYLLSKWRVPIANDFAVMVSVGLADNFFKKWLDSNDVYSFMRPSVSKSLISLDPSNNLAQIVDLIKQDKVIYNLFFENEAGKILEILSADYKDNKINLEINNYLKKFGTRVPDELKLESETLVENPEKFIQLIKTIIKSKQFFKKNVEFKINQYKNINLLKKIFLKWLLGWAGNSIRRREESRHRRALAFGYIRRIFITIGSKFEQEHLLKEKKDIFYLSVEEIFGLINNQKEIVSLLDVIERRKQKFIKWQKVEMPRRIETTKSIIEIEQELLKQAQDFFKDSLKEIKGNVASRPNNIDIFSGTALVLKRFNSTADFKGKILVTTQTDPGWTVIFPLLKGIVVERGGMLSHAAIVARELNIPCIVGVEKITDIINDGAHISLNLQNGLIKINKI